MNFKVPLVTNNVVIRACWSGSDIKFAVNLPNGSMGFLVSIKEPFSKALFTLKAQNNPILDYLLEGSQA